MMLKSIFPQNTFNICHFTSNDIIDTNIYPTKVLSKIKYHFTYKEKTFEYIFRQFRPKSKVKLDCR